jgi:hypothetical protein
MESFPVRIWQLRPYEFLRIDLRKINSSFCGETQIPKCPVCGLRGAREAVAHE